MESENILLDGGPGPGNIPDHSAPALDAAMLSVGNQPSTQNAVDVARQFGTEMSNTIAHQNIPHHAHTGVEGHGRGKDDLLQLVHGEHFPGGGDMIPNNVPHGYHPTAFPSQAPMSHITVRGQSPFIPQQNFNGYPANSYYNTPMPNQYTSVMPTTQPQQPYNVYPNVPISHQPVQGDGNSSWSATPPPIIDNIQAIKELKDTVVTLRQEIEQDKLRYQEDLAKTHQKFEAEVQRLEDMVQKMNVTPKQPTVKIPKDNPMQTPVHHAMKHLLLLPDPEPTGPNNTYLEQPLPEPLPQGAPPRQAPDGTRVFNPNWYVGATKDPINEQYVEATVKLAIMKEKENPGSKVPKETLNDEELVRATARQYFNTLRNNYRAQTTESGKAKKDKARENNKLRGRKRQKATPLRLAVPLAIATYGEEAMTGAYDLIQTDWMSSDHNDHGKMDEVAWKKLRRDRLGPNNEGWEVRPLLWRSKRLMRMYLMLRNLLKQQQDQEDQQQIATGKKLTKRATTARFIGDCVNYNDEVPMASKRQIMPYRSLVSRAWAERTGNQGIYLVEDSAECKALQFQVPDSMLTADDHAYITLYDD